MSYGLFAALYDAGTSFALIDSRERRDYVAGHWFGSTNIPLSLFSNLLQLGVGMFRRSGEHVVGVAIVFEYRNDASRGSCTTFGRL